MALLQGEAAAGSSSSSSSLLGDFFPLVSQPLSSTTRTFTNLILCIVGAGIMGLPYTFSNVGWVFGFFTLVLGGILSYRGMMLQIYSKRKLRTSRGELDLIIASYGDLAYHTFGPWGRLTVDVLLTLGIIASAIAHITLISQNFTSIVSSILGTHVQGMYVQGSHLYSHMAFSTADMQIVPAVFPGVGLLNSTRYDNVSSIKIDPAKNPDVLNLSRIALESYTFSGCIHEPSCKNGSSLGPMSVNLSFSVGSLTHHYLTRINWLSPAIYTWCIFPLIVGLGAIPSITSLAPLSTLGNILNFAALAAVMVSDALEIMTMSGTQDMEAFGDMVAVPSAFGVGVYAFQSAGIMIPMETSMEQPLKFGSVLGLAFILSGILYAIFAVLGYAAFGTNTQQVVTLNLPAGIEAVFIKALISFSMFLALPLVLIPMFELVERRFSQRKLSLGLRTLVVLIICLLATALKKFTDFLSLIGSSLACFLGFILPAAIHI